MKEFTHPEVKSRAVGCHVVISLAFTLCPISICMPYLLGRIRVLVAGKGASVSACWRLHSAKEASVCAMNEIVRKQ